MKKQPEESNQTSLRDKIVGLSESSGRKSYYPILQQKIKELQNEIADRHRAENTLRETLARIARQQAVIAEISTHPSVFHGRLNEAAPMIAAKMTHAMDVSRASLWLMHHTRLCCMDNFDAQNDTHSSGSCLDCASYPTYFDAISKGAIIADDARQDLRTRDIADHYIDPDDFASMLDVPVLIEGELTAVICFNHIGAPRI